MPKSAIEALNLVHPEVTKRYEDDNDPIDSTAPVENVSICIMIEK
jgi:hypothetical protein